MAGSKTQHVLAPAQETRASYIVGLCLGLVEAFQCLLLVAIAVAGVWLEEAAPGEASVRSKCAGLGGSLTHSSSNQCEETDGREQQDAGVQDGVSSNEEQNVRGHCGSAQERSAKSLLAVRGATAWWIGPR